MSYEHFPWFKEAKVKEIFNVTEEGPEHLHWSDLDIDLSLSIIEKPEKYPLVSSYSVVNNHYKCSRDFFENSVFDFA